MINFGDEFLVANTGILSSAIRWVSSFWAKGDYSDFSHAGIILNSEGTTLEATWRGIHRADMSRYIGKRVMVARYLDETLKKPALDSLRQFQDKPYPFWRLPLHLIPPLAKYIHLIKIPVCTEMNGYYQCQMKIRQRWWGLNPADMYNFYVNHRKYETVFLGVWGSDK